MCDAAAEADCRLAVARGIPCNSKSGLEIPPLLVHSGLAMESWIARERETGRRRWNRLALDSVIEVRETEVVNVTVLELHRHERRPTDSVIDGEFPRSFPRVLRIKRKVVLSQIFGIGVRLMKLRQFAGQKIGNRSAGSQ